MNILFIVTLSELGGAQKYVRDLALAYARDGHRVAVAAGPDRKNQTGDWKQGWLFREITNYQLPITNYFLPNLKRSTGLLREFRTLFDIITIIKKERPNVIHLNSTKIGGLGGLAGRLTGVTNVYTVHGLVLNEPLPLLLWLWYWFLEKIAFALCSKIIVISKFDQQRVINLGLATARKLKLIPLTVDPDALHFLPREEARRNIESRITNHESRNRHNSPPASTREDSSTRGGQPSLTLREGVPPLEARGGVGGVMKLIGTVANFYPTKDLPTLIEAVRIVVRQKTPPTSPPYQGGDRGGVKFVIIGDGPLRQSLESRIKNQELSDNVFLLGSIENASKLLPGLDLFVLSSVKEGLPQVLQEAVAAGIPIVSTNVGGIPDIYEKNFKTEPPLNPPLGKGGTVKECLPLSKGEMQEGVSINWILIPPRNPELLASNILYALDNLVPNPPKSKETLEEEFLDFVKTTMNAYSLNLPRQ